jgi:hypothetical protein
VSGTGTARDVVDRVSGTMTQNSNAIDINAVFII